MDEVDRAIAKFESTVVVYDMNQLSSVGDYSRRGSTTSFNFNWRSPLGLLQQKNKKKEITQFTVLTREAQTESVIFDFTDDGDLRCSFRDLQLAFLDDVEELESAILDEGFDGSLSSNEFQDAVFGSSVGIHGKPGSPKRIFDNKTNLHNLRLNGASSVGADVADVMPMTAAPPVRRQPRRRSLNPVSWWRY